MTGSAAPRLLFLRQSADIDRVKRLGRRCQTSVFTLLAFASGQPGVRVAVVVGRRFGGAVSRNRVKRVFRELARHSVSMMAGGYDLVVFPRREALGVPHAVRKEKWFQALDRQGLLTRC